MSRFTFTTDTPQAICPFPGCNQPSTNMVRLKSTRQIIGCARCVLEAAKAVDAGARRCGTCAGEEFSSMTNLGTFIQPPERTCNIILCRGKPSKVGDEITGCGPWMPK
jgi:hypothetical protein